MGGIRGGGWRGFCYLGVLEPIAGSLGLVLVFVCAMRGRFEWCFLLVLEAFSFFWGGGGVATGLCSLWALDTFLIFSNFPAS